MSGQGRKPLFPLLVFSHDYSIYSCWWYANGNIYYFAGGTCHFYLHAEQGDPKWTGVIGAALAKVPDGKKAGAKGTASKDRNISSARLTMNGSLY